MISGAHAIIYSTNAEADRAFLRDIIGIPFADGGEGWLIFGLPPAELGVHPADANDRHELFFMVDDVTSFVNAMAQRGFPCSPPEDQGWGIITQLTLPGGGKFGVYQPRHPRPKSMVPATSKPAAKRKVSKKKSAKGKTAAKTSSKAPASKRSAGKAKAKKPTAKKRRAKR